MKKILGVLRRWIRRNDRVYFALCGRRESVRRLRAYPHSELVLEANPQIGRAHV